MSDPDLERLLAQAPTRTFSAATREAMVEVVMEADGPVGRRRWWRRRIDVRVAAAACAVVLAGGLLTGVALGRFSAASPPISTDREITGPDRAAPTSFVSAEARFFRTRRPVHRYDMSRWRATRAE